MSYLVLYSICKKFGDNIIARPEGKTPIADVNWRFQWLWLYAFVHPKTGETY